MSFINSYKPLERQRITAPPDGPYDLNFNVPVPEKLETERVRLVPFVPAIHGRPFHNVYKRHPELERYLPITWLDYTDFLTNLEYMHRASPSAVLFAILDRTKPDDGANLAESIAGVIGYIDCSPQNLVVEIGPVIVLPAWQRTFVSSNAISLLLKYALNLPSEGGLGFRRVIWSANPNNQASMRAAERMGFTLEGVKRWSWILPPGRDGGKPPVDGKRGKGEGRDSAVLSVCWDDWEERVKERVEEMIKRV